jgi:hypothetical protein
MKKILYIVPILVFAMVALTQDAQAQQSGNASNGITQAAANGATGAALNTTANTGSDAAGGSTGSTVTTPPAAPAPAAVSAPAGAPAANDGGISPQSLGDAFPPAAPSGVTVTPGGTVVVSFTGFTPGETVSFTLIGENAAGASLA